MPNALVDNFSKEQLEKLVIESTTMIELLKRIGYKCISGRSGDIVKRRLKMYNIDYSHFNLGNIDLKKRTFENSFCENSTASSSYIRRHYFNEYTDKYECSICGQQPYWNNKELSLTLDHVNGNYNDNRLSNLRWVCPNCDRQLDTFGSKNKKKKNKDDNEIFYCIECGKNTVSKKGNSCKECVCIKNRVVERPTREELKEMIRLKSFMSIGKHYGVSDNTIKKWCDAYHLPRLKKDINSYSDEDWFNI